MLAAAVVACTGPSPSRGGSSAASVPATVPTPQRSELPQEGVGLGGTLRLLRGCLALNARGAFIVLPSGWRLTADGRLLNGTGAVVASLGEEVRGDGVTSSVLTLVPPQCRTEPFLYVVQHLRRVT